MPYANPDARREYARRWVAERRAAYFADKCCVDCGAVDHLELDHRDPMQKINHRIWSWSAARRNAELVKCVVRCKPCHKIKTQLNKDYLNVTRVKLTERAVAEIRSLYAAGNITQRALADQYGVSRAHVTHVINGDFW